MLRRALQGVSNIAWDALHQKGVRRIVFDKDNCLTAPYKTEIHPPFKDSWESCLKTFGKGNVMIVSNSIGTLDDPDYAEKPLCGDEICTAFGIRASERSSIAMIGDRLFTDVLLGNLYGFYSVWTKDIVTESGDNPMAVK
ncbi:hypothetical protein EV182_004883, partial [Spiromyces aspiralis]